MKIDQVRIIALLLLTFISCGTDRVEVSMEREGDVFVNQVGYLTGEEKFFLTTSSSSAFSLCDAKTGEVVYRGKSEIRVEGDRASGMTLRKGDFSSFDSEGEYFIFLKDQRRSCSFRIGSDLYNNVRDVSLKSYYYQRSGIALDEEFAGSFHRPAGHRDPLYYHESSPLSGSADVSGGWYDAGDYGRYITPGAVSLGIMMMGYEQYPHKFYSDQTGIPESGNGTPDFLDEMRFELEWMLKMQYRGDQQFHGALPYMVNSREYVWEMPHEDSQAQLIYDFSSIATADFAAVTAQAYRLFAPYDMIFAQSCLDASLAAWSFLEGRGTYPEKGFERPADTVTGGYAESADDNRNDKDDRLWAAVELYRSTGRAFFHDYVKEEMSNVSYFSGNMNWMDTSGFAHMSYVLAKKEIADIEIQEKMKTLLYRHCDRLLEVVENEGFYIALNPREYQWGSNGEVMTRAEYFLFAHLISGEEKYRQAALFQLNYILGLNPVNISYVTGLGSVSPMNIHHATMATDGIDLPFPGFVPGGPNSRLHGDYTLPEFFHSKTPPALCYVDHVDSWASNENCITYNAPLIPVAAFFSEI